VQIHKLKISAIRGSNHHRIIYELTTEQHERFCESLFLIGMAEHGLHKFFKEFKIIMV
jgi:hypothetical protein